MFLEKLKIRAIHFGLIFYFLSPTNYANPIYVNKVTEAASCAAVIAVISEHTLHVQDLDNTIIRPTQTLGSDEWFGATVSAFINDGLSKDEAISKAGDRWARVQKVTRVQTVEPFIFPNLISFFLQQNDHLRDIALTARPPELATTTIDQLRTIGLDFSLKNPFGGKKRIEIRDPQFPEPVVIEGGIVFAGPRNNKGRVLAYLLNPLNGYNGYRAGFERIVFADDKELHAQHVLREVLTRMPRIDVYSFRIGSADKIVANYNPFIAKAQWEEFERSGRLLSDEEALRPR